MQPFPRGWHLHLTLYGTIGVMLHVVQRLISSLLFQDGVLVRGKNALPAAKEALSMLDGNNKFGLKIPFILVNDLPCLFCDIHPEQFIQAHTVLKSVVNKYADQPVLVLGGKGNTLRTVAEGYGFQQVYTTLDILAWNESIWPFHDLTQEERASVKTTDFSKIPFGAIFVFHDPRNWALDIQIICDVIQSRGVIGSYRESNHMRKPVDLVFCNPDLIWQSDFEAPRMGQGAFKIAFQAVFQASMPYTTEFHSERSDTLLPQALTGSTYPHTQIGKPTEATYKFAEMMLKRHLLGVSTPSLYMIGDNPESDIAGANAAGWKSILVRSGVYDPRHGPPSHRPTHEAEDVAEAVYWALEQEMRSYVSDGNLHD
ncbi:hypothetical protein AZE42_01703 [Rhizopogon vesiculosus]|uniref:Uncharacterized protein n=1 Tax=Rhizopogon vesiculosus TaxID=180088 RepID=A0A1J8QFI1_9AGAM|nr:hypothetical protein AZE42_01703 [Rhizopogon vesiculosus]